MRNKTIRGKVTNKIKPIAKHSHRVSESIAECGFGQFMRLDADD